MNGYKIQADSYKQYLENNPNIEASVRASIEKNIKVFNFLATCDNEEIMEIFNSGAFNDVLRGYLRMALDNMELEDKLREKIISGLFQEIRYLFDSVTASQAEDYYNTH